MKILLIVDCYLPATKSAALMIHELGVKFSHLGHNVIITAPDDSLTQRCEISKEYDLTILRVRTGKIKTAGRFNRALNEIMLSATIWKAGKTFFQANPCDMIVFYSPSIFFASLVKKLKKLWKCKTYMILRDIFPKWAIDTGVMKKGPVYWFFKHKELQQYSAADIIGVESAGYLPYFAGQGIDKKCRIEVLYNWTTLNEKKIITNHKRKKLGLDDKFVFFYGGNIGIAQEMDNIVKLAENLQNHPRLHFLLVGDGSEVTRLNTMIKARQLTNITIHPPVSQQDYLGMLSQFDVGLISLNRKLDAHNFPGKILGYMYFAKPILASINPGNELKRILQDSNAGLVSISGDHCQLRNHALKLARDTNLCGQMGRNGRVVLEERFSVERAVSQILSCIQESQESVDTVKPETCNDKSLCSL